jgi:hypothetical protein
MLFARARQQQIAQSKKSQKADNSISGVKLKLSDHRLGVDGVQLAL